MTDKTIADELEAAHRAGDDRVFYKLLGGLDTILASHVEARQIMSDALDRIIHENYELSKNKAREVLQARAESVV